VCAVETKGSAVWVKAIKEKKCVGETSFFDDVQNLLQEFPNGIYLGRLDDEFHRKFGKAVPRQGKSESLSTIVRRAESEGVCKLEKRGSTEYWVVPSK